MPEARENSRFGHAESHFGAFIVPPQAVDGFSHLLQCPPREALAVAQKLRACAEVISMIVTLW